MEGGRGATHAIARCSLGPVVAGGPGGPLRPGGPAAPG